MSRRRIALADMPDWPRFLTRDQAAAYVGVSTSLFDAEVADGLWPRPFLRGAKHGLHTWDRLALDAVADARSPVHLPGRQNSPDDFEIQRAAAERDRARQRAEAEARPSRRQLDRDERFRHFEASAEAKRRKSTLQKPTS